MAAYHETREQRRTRGMSHGCSLFPLFPPCGEVAKKEKESASSNAKDREQPEDEEGGKETRRLALTISRLRFAYAWPARRPEIFYDGSITDDGETESILLNGHFPRVSFLESLLGISDVV